MYAPKYASAIPPITATVSTSSSRECRDALPSSATAMSGMALIAMNKTWPGNVTS